MVAAPIARNVRLSSQGAAPIKGHGAQTSAQHDPSGRLGDGLHSSSNAVLEVIHLDSTQVFDKEMAKMPLGSETPKK